MTTKCNIFNPWQSRQESWLNPHPDLVLTPLSSATSRQTWAMTFIAEHYVDNHVKSLWAGDATWRHRSGSKLVHVMAYCLTASSQYLNQCWLISEVQWQSPEGNFTKDTSAINNSNYLGIHIYWISLRCPRDQLINGTPYLTENKPNIWVYKTCH